MTYLDYEIASNELKLLDAVQKTTPSPHGSGERVGVRGKGPLILKGIYETLVLPLTLRPPHPIPLPRSGERENLRLGERGILGLGDRAFVFSP